MKIANKVIQWPKHIVPHEEIHKLQGEFTDDVDTFAGHHEYRADCITRSGTFFGGPCCAGDMTTDNAWYIDQYQYGMPGDFAEDASY
jgi:hypothetical protein